MATRIRITRQIGLQQIKIGSILLVFSFHGEEIVPHMQGTLSLDLALMPHSPSLRARAAAAAAYSFSAKACSAFTGDGRAPIPVRNRRQVRHYCR
jgi:hypothetical protein